MSKAFDPNYHAVPPGGYADDVDDLRREMMFSDFPDGPPCDKCAACRTIWNKDDLNEAGLCPDCQAYIRGITK